MPKKTKSEIQVGLEPFHDRLRSVVDASFKEVRHVTQLRAENGYSPYLYSRTFANNVFDSIAQNAIREFGMEDKIQVRTEPQTVKFLFPGGILLRFKKGNEAFLGQNQPTLAVKSFTHSDGLFADLPANTSKVEIVWRANELKTKLENVFVVARDGDSMLWKYEIDPIATADIVKLTDPSLSPEVETDVMGVVTPKSAKKPDAKSDNDN